MSVAERKAPPVETKIAERLVPASLAGRLGATAQTSFWSRPERCS